MSGLIPMSNSDLGRYMRLMNGESTEEIASIDGVSVSTVQKSVARGAAFSGQTTIMEIQHMRDQGAKQNEAFRQRVRAALESSVEEAIADLVKAQNEVPEINKKTGEVTIKKYKDLKIMIEGVKLYRSTVSLEEKPQATTVIQNNIQQNNTQNNMPGPEGMFDFETQLQAIRRQQKEAHSTRVIDVPAESSKPSEDEGVGF